MDYYFIASFVVTVILMSTIVYCIYRKPQLVSKLQRMLKEPIQKLLYCLLMYFAALSYIICSLICDDTIFSAFGPVINSIYLLLSICGTNRFYEQMLSKNILKDSDKKRGIALAYLTVVLFGFFFALSDKSDGWINVPSIAIAVLIGSYISIEDCLHDFTPKKIVYVCKVKIKQVFQEIKKNSWIIIILLGGSGLQVMDWIKSIQYGIGAGVMAFIFIFFIYAHASKE